MKLILVLKQLNVNGITYFGYVLEAITKTHLYNGLEI